MTSRYFDGCQYLFILEYLQCCAPLIYKYHHILMLWFLVSCSLLKIYLVQIFLACSYSSLHTKVQIEVSISLTISIIISNILLQYVQNRRHFEVNFGNILHVEVSKVIFNILFLHTFVLQNSIMFEPNTSSVFSNQDWSPAGSIHAHDYKNDYSNNLNKHYQPLGRSYSHDHYIKPIPPMYVTEYEAAYTWPPSTAYSPQAQYNYYKGNLCIIIIIIIQISIKGNA